MVNLCYLSERPDSGFVLFQSKVGEAHSLCLVIKAAVCWRTRTVFQKYQKESLRYILITPQQPCHKVIDNLIDTCCNEVQNFA